MPRYRPLRTFHVYILASKLRVLYVGITGNPIGRVWEHKEKRIPGFTQRYNVDQLVYYEAFHDVRTAIGREKQIKGWRRGKKLNLIEAMNPEWKDLSAEWYSPKLRTKDDPRDPSLRSG